MICYHKDISLQKCLTLHTPTTASLLVECASEDAIISYLSSLSDAAEPVILGSGANVLFVDDVVPMVLRPNILGKTIIEKTENHTLIRVGAGEIWDDFVQSSLELGCSGLENLSGIPSSVGAAPVQNIGAYGAEAAQFISRVQFIDRETLTVQALNSNECSFAYRTSIFKQNPHKYIITFVDFLLPNKFLPNTNYRDLKENLPENPTPLDVRNAVLKIRASKLPDPKDIGSVGSFFKNPELNPTQAQALKALLPDVPLFDLPNGNYKASAAYLIEKAGLKGFQQGNVATYHKHALIIINPKNNATGQEILNFSQLIIDIVYQKFQVRLFPEVVII